MSYETPQCPNDLAIELGEFFYQLRAALDAAMYEAMCITTCNPPPDADRIYFPICRGSDDFKSKRHYFSALPKPMLAWLRSLQEYCRNEVKGTPTEAMGVLLTLLNNCASSDRHRQLHVVAALPHEVSGALRIPIPGRLVGYKILDCNLLNNDSLFMTFDIEGDFVGDICFMNAAFNVDLSVGEVPASSGEELNNILYSMQVVAGDILDRFEQELHV